MKVVQTGVERWFAPMPARRLAALRVAVGAYTLWYVGRRRGMFKRMAATDPNLYAPVGLAVVGAPQPLPQPVARAAVDATLVAGAAFTLGAGHRVTGPAYASLLLWTLSYRNSWSMIYHSDNQLVLHALALGVAPSADVWSVDALIRERCGGKRRGDVPSWRYGWPIRYMRTVSTLGYCVAGIAKVKGPMGWRWASGESMRRQVAMDGMRKELLGESAAPAAYAMYRYVRVWRALAAGSLALELLAPLVLPSSRLSRIWAANVFLMHWGILGTMGIRFRYQLSGVAFLSFVDLERLVPRVTWR